MKKNRLEGKRFKNSVIAAFMIMGASTMMFQGFTQVATAAEYNKTNTVPTSYEKQLSYTNNNSLPEGYKKTNYTVKDINLPFYRSQTPTSKDITKKDAAEIGAQALWSIYGLSLEGQVIEMGYQPATENIPRSTWCGDVLINGVISYGFEVDSVTGEIFSVIHSRTLNKKVSVGYDSSLAGNNSEYAELAKKTAEKFNVVHGAVAAVDYNCQGFANDDPDITFNLKGENGEVASMTFSRYDKALLSISYHAGFQYTLKTIEKLDQKMQEMDLQIKKAASSSNGNQTPSLIVFEQK